MRYSNAARSSGSDNTMKGLRKMKKSSRSFVRMLTLLAMVLSLVGMASASVMTASAQVVDFAPICVALDTNQDGVVDADEVQALAIDVDGDGDIDAQDYAIVIAACDAVPSPGGVASGSLNAFICESLDDNGDGTVDQAEAQDLAIDLDGDGDVDADDQAIVIIGCNQFLGGELGTGTVNISKFYCDNVDATEYHVDLPAGAVTAAVVVDDPNCVPGDALFTFYLYGDGTNDFVQLAVDDSGSIGLGEGVYRVVEEGTQAAADVEVVEDMNTNVVVLNPIEAAGVPGDGDGDGGAGAPDGGDGDGGAGAPAPAAPAAGAPAAPAGAKTVSGLPSTGAGEQGSNNQVMIAGLLAGAAVLGTTGLLVSPVRRSTGR